MAPFPPSAVAAKAAIRRGDVSAEALTSHFLAKIAETNPGIGAVRFVLAEQALEAARALDRRLKAGGPIPALAGIPVVVKENCDTVGAPCSAGLENRADYRPSTDATVVRRLREAGAIILGVSVSDPGAFGVRTLEVVHPQDSSLTVGGSSGGSAAAIAAGYCLAAVGTDTGGSIRIPSACCGTVGLKPSFAALPMDGIFPLIPSLDHVGPMANTVEDVSLLWQVLQGGSQGGTSVRSVGYDSAWVNDADPTIADTFAEMLERFQRAGIQAMKVELPHLDDVGEMHGRIFFVEGAAHHYANCREHIPSYPKIAQNWFEKALEMKVIDYVEACETRVRFTRDVDRILSEVDLIVTPTLSVLHPRLDAPDLLIDGQSRDFTLGMVRQTCLFNHTGHPALAMPMRDAGTMPPPSLQIIGRRSEELRVLALGQKLEGNAFA